MSEEKTLMDYRTCVEACGFDQLPEWLEKYHKVYNPKEALPIVGDQWLKEVCDLYGAGDHWFGELKRVADQIRNHEALSYFTGFLLWELQMLDGRLEENHYDAMVPDCLGMDKDFYPFLLLLSCVVPSEARVEKRGVPSMYYQRMPKVPMKKQFEKLVVSKDPRIDDFQWDVLFYTCSIYYFERFNFIPCRLEEPIAVYRNNDRDQVQALYLGGHKFREDGQVDGNNGIYGKAPFVSRWYETRESLVANPVNPIGFLEKETISLNKNQWRCELKEGDTMLAFHIPDGPGYTPEKVRVSMEMALDFYGRYYPEIPIKGFMSESWLFDPRLNYVLDEGKSRILDVAKQFYCFPMKGTGQMIVERVFGLDPLNEPAYQPKTSLQESVLTYLRSGGRFNTSGMFVLLPEVAAVGKDPYVGPEDLKAFMETVDCKCD